MTRGTAEAITRQLLIATRALNEARRIIAQSEEPESAFNGYTRKTGAVLGAIYLDLMKPVVARYPDLDPARDNTP